MAPFDFLLHSWTFTHQSFLLLGLDTLRVKDDIVLDMFSSHLREDVLLALRVVEIKHTIKFVILGACLSVLFLDLEFESSELFLNLLVVSAWSKLLAS